LGLKLVLDTNVYCDFAEGVPDTVEAIALHGQFLFIPSVVLGELFFGFMKGSRASWNERKLRQMMDRLRVEIIDITQDVARKYALIYLSLVRKGAKIPINDVWVAACCMEVGGTLLTRDRHFEYVDQIDIYIPGR
jgi:predicted nucleic acid-binding protein